MAGYDNHGQWTGNTSGSIKAEDAVKSGLGGAFSMITNRQPLNYPGYVPTETNKPEQQSYYNYQSNTPLSGVATPNYTLNNSTPSWKNTNVGTSNISAPTANTQGFNWQGYGQAAPQYQGLMGGDYNRLESALAAPGSIAAQNAYNSASQNLNSAMTGRGLYGSSIMSNQANQGLNREYMNAMASNAATAAANRYGLQQEDLANASGQQMQGWQSLLGESNARNQAGLGYAELGTKTNLANAANALSAEQGNQSAQMELNKLLMNQGLAQNQQGLDVYKQQMAQTQQMNQYNLNKAAQDMESAKAVYEANVQDAARKGDYDKARMDYENAYNETLRDWQNNQAFEKYKYDVTSLDYANKMNTQMLNEYLALAGYGAPLQTATAAQNSGNSQGWAALLAALMGGG